MKKPLRSEFTHNFIMLNHCQQSFGQWHFKAGMCFGDREKWWSKDTQPRITAHEGLDFCCYIDQNNAIVWFKEKVKIPALYDGQLAEIFDDFIGQSLLVRHFPEEERPFCSIYAHTIPDSSLGVGSEVKAGQCLGHCAPGSNVPMHLHLSVIRLSPFEKVTDWPRLISKHCGDFLDPSGFI